MIIDFKREVSWRDSFVFLKGNVDRIVLNGILRRKVVGLGKK